MWATVSCLSVFMLDPFTELFIVDPLVGIEKFGRKQTDGVGYGYNELI